MAAGSVGGSGSKTPTKIMANIFISFLGAGVLGLPFAFKEAGILEGILIMTTVGLISVKAMLLIIDCKYKLIQKYQPATANGITKVVGTTEEKEVLLESELNGVAIMQPDEPSLPVAKPGQHISYGDVGYYAIGNTGRLLVELAIVVSQIGFCCAYLIFICENLSDYVHGLRLIHWLLILLPPLACLTLLRHLSSLAISSLFAQLSNGLAFLVVFWFDFEHFSTVSLHPKEISLEGFPFFLAIAIYCYEGAGMILSLESSVAPEVRHHFKWYFKITLSIVTLLYIAFGACGYLSFGPATNEIITLNLPKGDSVDFAIVVKCCLCLALFFTYPVMMFPVIGILEHKLLSKPSERLWRGNVLRFCLVTMTGGIVMCIPNFANLMALVGATCCTLIAFVLPGLFHMKIFKGSLSKADLALDIFLITLGIVGTIVGTLDALERLQESRIESDLEESESDLVEFGSNLNSTLNNLTTTVSSIITTTTSSTNFSSKAVEVIEKLAGKN